MYSICFVYTHVFHVNVHMHVCLCARVRVRVAVRVRVHVCERIPICIFACVHVYIYVMRTPGDVEGLLSWLVWLLGQCLGLLRVSCGCSAHYHLPSLLLGALALDIH